MATTLTWTMARGAVLAAAGMLAGFAVGALKELRAVRDQRDCRAMAKEWIADHSWRLARPTPTGALRQDDLDLEE